MKNTVEGVMRGVALLLALSVLAACSGGGAGDSEDNAAGNLINETVEAIEQEQGLIGGIKADVEATDQIVASESFSFTVDTLITLSVDVSSGEKGVVHVYTQREELEGLLMPDPMSRIDSFNPDYGDKVELLVSSGSKELILYWVPMTADGQEQVIALSLLPGQSEYAIAF